MKDTAPKTIYLKDYAAFGWAVDSVHLTFDLAPNTTRVKSRVAFSLAPDAPPQNFFLHGENLTLIRATINGVEVSPEITPEGLQCAVPDGAFVWEAEVEIDPKNNTALEGLYMSNGMYTLQTKLQ